MAALEAFSLIGRVALEGADKVASGMNTISKNADTTRRHFERFGNETFRTFKDVKGGTDEVSRAIYEMKNEMRQAMREQKQALSGFRLEQLKTQKSWWDLNKSMKTYTGSTKDFMNEINKLGKAEKKINDEMMKHNEIAKMGIIQSIGQLNAMSTGSEKVAGNYKKMKNPLLSVNNGLLGISHGLENIAKAGNPAALALKMVGPKANMKELQDQIGIINKGMMRVPAVALVAVAGVALVFGALHKGAMKNAEYKKSFEDMGKKVQQAFQPMVDLFAQIMIPVFDFISAIADLVIQFNTAHPVLAKMIAGFLMLIPVLMLILTPLAMGIGFFNGLLAVWSMVSMFIMPLITGLAAMSGTVLLVAAGIVLLIALGVLIYKNWDTILKWLQTAWEAVKTYFAGWGASIMAAWNTFKGWMAGLWTGILNILKGVGSFLLNFTPFGILLKIIIKNFGAIKKFISITLQMIKALWKVAWNAISGFLSPIIAKIKNTITNGFNAVVRFLTPIFTRIKSTVTTVFNAIRSTISNVTNTIKGVVSRAFTAVKNAMEKPINAAKSTIRNAINAIKSLFAGLRLKFPKPKIPSFSVTKGVKSVAGVDVPYPKVSIKWLARGGLFNQPTIAGLGEAGREAVINLEKKKYFKPFSQAIAENIAALQGGSLAGARIEIPLILNNREILRAILPDLDRELARRQARSGGLINRGNL